MGPRQAGVANQGKSFQGEMFSLEEEGSGVLADSGAKTEENEISKFSGSPMD